MFFNYDSFEIVAIAFVLSGILTYSLYNSSGPINNESLVNTISNKDVSNNLSTSQLIDAGIQTEANLIVEPATTYVNTGVQTSARMWLETLRNWITEILGTPTNHSATGQYVDVGVQTNAPSLWGTVKQWFFDIYSIRSSELSSIGHNRVDNWRNNLDSIQSVDLNDSESPLTTIAFGSPNNIQNLVGPNDSASNISEVVSESGLQNVESASNVVESIIPQLIDPTQIPLPASDISMLSQYQINDLSTYNNLLVLPDARFSQVLIDGVHHYFIVLNNAILSVNPDIMNLFI